MGKCDFGIANQLIINIIASFAMTGFFLVSGFSLYYRYQSKDLKNNTNLKNFYIKRAIAIMPIYLLVVIIHGLFLENILSTKQLHQLK